MTTIESKDPSLESEGGSGNGGATATLTAHAAVEAPSRTLPPVEAEPDGPRSAASVALERYELDMAGRLHAADYQATIAMLCEQFELQMRALMQPAFGGHASMYASSESHGFGFAISRTKSGERS